MVGNDMGNGMVKVRTIPEDRNLCRQSLIECSAFIISHEHADHFNIHFLKDLYKIRGSALFLIPDLCSYALQELLEKIGFEVMRYGSGDKILIGSLEIMALPCLYSRYEPDVYALMFKATDDENVFFTCVDAIPTQPSLEYVRQNSPALRLDNFTNNYVARKPNQHFFDFANKKQALNQVNNQLNDFVQKMQSRHVVISGLGWKYHEDSMNATMFHVHHPELKIESRKKVNLFTANFLDKYVLLDGDLHLERKTEYKTHGRTYIENYNLEEIHKLKYASIERFEDLSQWVLKDLSRYIMLGCKKINKAIHYLIMEGGFKNLCLGIYDSNIYHVFSYEINKGGFISIGQVSDLNFLMEEYTMGLVINSEILDGIRTGSEEAHICFEIEAITWNNRPDLLNEYVDVDIASVLHPRYRTKEYMDFYLSQL